MRKGTVEIVCDDVFAAELPRGEARLVYADPPYTEDDVHGYGIGPNAERLLELMHELAAPDAAFVLHTGEPNLHRLLPVAERLAPQRRRHFPGQQMVRVFPWVKPWTHTSRRNAGFQRMWEPILVWYGRGYRNPLDLTEPDWICALRNRPSRGGFPTQKPAEIIDWLFGRMLANTEPGRVAVDLFAGSGTAALDAARRGLHAYAIDHDPDACRLIEQRALATHKPPRQRALNVEVTPSGRVNWPTLGRGPAELVDDLLPLGEQQVHA